MAEKNAFANMLDKLAQGKPDKGEDFNILPKPVKQDIGYGLIVWQWFVGDIIIESALATNEVNRLAMPEGEYSITMTMPESNNHIYALDNDLAKDLGKAILSAWNWKEIWKVHAGDLLLQKLSKEPGEQTLEVSPFDSPPRIPDPLKVLAPKKPEEETFDA